MAELNQCSPKAYLAYDKDSMYSTIVFASTRTQAKVEAMTCECCEDTEYIDIRVNRMPAADKLYKGRSEIDWDDQETRMALVRDLGWSCFEPSWMCDTCEAKPYCHWHEEDGGKENA